ncbi:MAG: bifunctional acetate--CoA ligase family protein/GNAT family N-acetyltransferase [Anaerolineae bacterium]|nr:bifunctional acetate--CoA ligase family protein/GNAT family N-acetyltransferase [Thermoflexales bacterium]MDW8407645.1 bifunctional acetate--CoA ligase family protein/GNAT family N-acetyltransferase [Anaerolineae bacterium]
MDSTISPVVDPTYDVIRSESRALDAIFHPHNVAVIGATENPGTVGRTVLWNLISSPFGGTVYPVNPKRPSVLGIKAYPTILDVPDKVDLAVIVTPAVAAPGVMAQCVDAGVKGVIIISAGFKETGPAGVELERQVLEQARRGGIRVIGPNCLGVMNCHNGLNATFATTIARPGNIGFISQSGALCTAVLDWSLRENVGFTSFVSIGSMLDVGWGDLIYYLGDDPRTNAIVIYMETIGDARSFISAAREVALTKPIIIIKPGRTEGAAKAAASHTGSLTGSDEVLDTAFKRCGVLRVNTIAELFYMAEVLAKQPRPQGPHLTIVTNAGGPGVLATDALITGGGELAELSKETYDTLNSFLPPAWSHNNPVDILGDAPPERYAKSLEVCAKDPNSDGMLVILTPQAMTDPTQTAEALKPYAQNLGKPVIASWMGGADVAAGEAILNRANIPTFAYPDTAARMFDYMWQYTRNLQTLYETPRTQLDLTEDAPDRALAEQIIAKARNAGRTILTEYESKTLLKAYHIPTVETIVATSEDDAVKAADQIGYPVVLKLNSETITHKTDVGGVQLNLRDAEAVRRAYNQIQASVSEKAGPEHFGGVTVQPMIKLDGYEVIVGSSIDPQFGPVLLFGSGGQLVEVYKDSALALPPLTTTLARHMMEQTKIFTALKGVRGRKPVDLEALERLLVQFGTLVAEQDWIREIDINPLLASPERLVALDARVVLYAKDTPPEKRHKLSIRPYPSQYMSTATCVDGLPFTIRPILPEDEPLMVKFHETLSDRSVYMRYLAPFGLSQRVSHERLSRLCFIDYDREIALVAEHAHARTGEREIMAVGRISRLRYTNDARFTMLVSDVYQCRGIGTALLSRMIDVARQEKINRLIGVISVENEAMQRLCRKLGFALHGMEDKKLIRAELALG